LRRSLHNKFEAVAGLAGNMAGLCFSYTHKLVPAKLYKNETEKT